MKCFFDSNSTVYGDFVEMFFDYIYPLFLLFIIFYQQIQVFDLFAHSGHRVQDAFIVII